MDCCRDVPLKSSIYHPYGNICEANSNTNCGSHGNACNTSKVANSSSVDCSPGTCKATGCSSGHVYNGTCEANSNTNCGSYGNSCGSNYVCYNATCIVSNCEATRAYGADCYVGNVIGKCKPTGSSAASTLGCIDEDTRNTNCFKDNNQSEWRNCKSSMYIGRGSTGQCVYLGGGL